MLTILLLGEPAILLDGQALRVTRRKSRALLFYLAAHGQPVARERLLATLWPDHPRQSAQQVLRTTLHGLRTGLGDAVEVRDDTIRLVADRVDTQVLETTLGAAAARGRVLEDALRLYRGDFLQGFELPEGPFDEWATAERERYRTLVVRGWARLARHFEDERDYGAALDAIANAVQLEPLQEDFQRSAMRLHYRAGDRTAAIRRYEMLTTMLDEELGVPPMAETRALYQAIVADTLPAEPEAATPARGVPAHVAFVAPAAALPFAGRANELRQLRDATARRCLALIEGEPGIGKTRLAHQSIDGLNVLVLAGAGRELERGLPYQPIIDMLRGLMANGELQATRLPELWMQELRRLVPELGLHLSTGDSSPGPPDESRLWEAISQLLQALGRSRPVVLLLDDLQWADASTLGLLGYLARQPGPASLRLLATTRGIVPRTPLADLVQVLTREERLVRLELSRLAPDEVLALARHLSRRNPELLGRWLQETTEGNPYILTELVRHARQHGLLGADGELLPAAQTNSPVVPRTVYSLMEARLHTISEPARWVLDTAVAAGREWEWEVVARATGLSEQAMFLALEELQAARLIRPFDETRYTFEHSLLMEVAYRDVGEPRHRLMHRRVAEALESMSQHRLDAVAGLLAQHYAEGNRPDRAAHYARQAARRAAGLAAWSEAIAFLEQALAGTDPADHGPILMELGEAQVQCGEAGQAVDTLRQAIAVLEQQPDDQWGALDAARLVLGRALLVQSRTDEVVALAREVRAAGRAGSTAQAEFLWGTALGHAGADLGEASRHLEAAAELFRAAESGDPAMVAAATFELGNIAAQQGDLHRAIVRYTAALEIVEPETQAPGLVWHILAHNNLAFHLHLLHEAGAIEHALEGLRLARERGMLSLQPFLLSTLGEIALGAGDLDRAEAYFREGLALAQRVSARERVAGLMANLGRLASHRGDPARAVERLTTALAEAEGLGNRHLEAQIRLWLAPLLPADDARAHLAAARAIAAQGARRLMLDDIMRLEATLALR